MKSFFGVLLVVFVVVLTETHAHVTCPGNFGQVICECGTFHGNCVSINSAKLKKHHGWTPVRHQIQTCRGCIDKCSAVHATKQALCRGKLEDIDYWIMKNCIARWRLCHYKRIKSQCHACSRDCRQKMLTNTFNRDKRAWKAGGQCAQKARTL